NLPGSAFGEGPPLLAIPFASGTPGPLSPVPAARIAGSRGRQTETERALGPGPPATPVRTTPQGGRIPTEKNGIGWRSATSPALNRDLQLQRHPADPGAA